MNALDFIMTRRSMRSFTDQPVSHEDVQTILEAAMAAPTANNIQDWRFVVIDDPDLLRELPSFSPYMGMAGQASCAVLVCGDLQAGKNPAKDSVYWQQNGAAAIQNMLLAARVLEIGSCWCGIYPREERVAAFSQRFGLPPQVLPLGLVVFGYPTQAFVRKDRFDPQKISYNHWDWHAPGAK